MRVYFYKAAYAASPSTLYSQALALFVMAKIPAFFAPKQLNFCSATTHTARSLVAVCLDQKHQI